MTIGFELLATDGAARRGRIELAHGTVETPAFMPVGTAATVKAMRPESVAATGAEILFGNTYHLMLRPTAERIAELGCRSEEHKTELQSLMRYSYAVYCLKQHTTIQSTAIIK